jgi:hypothetical protein
MSGFHPMVTMSIKSLIALLLFSTGLSAYASSNPQLYTLSWTTKGETLTYRSCGCADSCWLAWLRDRRTKRLKATLRCDCENLFAVFPANSKEKPLEQSCSAINESPEKFRLISEKMKEIVKGKKK